MSDSMQEMTWPEIVELKEKDRYWFTTDQKIIIDKAAAEITRLKEELQEEKEFKQRQLKVLENNRRELISNYEEELAECKSDVKHWINEAAFQKRKALNENKQG